MYERLTALLPALYEGNYGEWVTADVFPHVDYSDAVRRLGTEIARFACEHPEYELARFDEITEANGIGRSAAEIGIEDFGSLGGQAILAFLFGVFRRERICEGPLLLFCENGWTTACLERLKALDEAQNGSPGPKAVK